MKRPPAETGAPIFLVGMMGSGKSTLGRLLARELARPFVDLDERIEDRAGFSIPEIFARFGEPRFRDLESAALAELRADRDLVVALGGGTPRRESNRAMLRAGGCVVYLRAQPETLVRRLPHPSSRPLLRRAEDPQQTIQELLAEREPLYEEVADIVIDNEDDLATTLGRLTQALRSGGWIGP